MAEQVYHCLLDDELHTQAKLEPMCIYYRVQKTSVLLRNAVCKTKCKNPELMGLEDRINEEIKNRED